MWLRLKNCNQVCVKKGKSSTSMLWSFTQMLNHAYQHRVSSSLDGCLDDLSATCVYLCWGSSQYLCRELITWERTAVTFTHVVLMVCSRLCVLSSPSDSLGAAIHCKFSTSTIMSGQKFAIVVWYELGPSLMPHRGELGQWVLKIFNLFLGYWTCMWAHCFYYNPKVVNQGCEAGFTAVGFLEKQCAHIYFEELINTPYFCKVGGFFCIHEDWYWLDPVPPIST